MSRNLSLITTILLVCFACNQKPKQETTSDKASLDTDTTELLDSLNLDTTQEEETTSPAITYRHDLFTLRNMEESLHKKIGFISLSDIYQMSDHPDSSAIPDLSYKDKSSLRYFTLNDQYRKRFLARTNLSETDSVFIYDYDADVLLSFSVKSLTVVAYLSDYMGVDDCPCDPYDYMLGFEVPKSRLTKLKNSYFKSLVALGTANPFAEGGILALEWKKITSEEFPRTKSSLAEVTRHQKVLAGPAYLAESDQFQFYIEDYLDQYNTAFILDRHLIVVSKANNKVVKEAVYSSSEGTTSAPLNFGINNSNYSDVKAQWTGKLFKNEPAVIFGFEWFSFGCPRIEFIQPKYKGLPIYCDNRH